VNWVTFDGEDQVNLEDFKTFIFNSPETKQQWLD